MKVSYKWLQEYVAAPLPPPEELAEVFTMHASEVEGVEKVGDDTVLDVAILPNRTHDCLSHVGIAREIALLFNLEAKPPSWVYKGDSLVSTAEAITLSVPEGVPVRRALKRLAVDVKVGESPAWLKERLTVLGQRSINNIVDATNFVMFETGQPVHAFDLDKLSGGEQKNVYIRNAGKGEKITTLDGKEYALDETTVVIADSEKALDIAGIKGGAASGIDERTTRVLLSACTFHPGNIRKTSRKLGLVTDASKRFEQELSPVLAERAMNRLAEIIADIAGARVAADTVEFYPKKRNPYVIGVATDEVNHLLGTTMSDADVEAILTRLGFEWRKVKPIDEVLRLVPTLAGTPYTYGASISYDAPNAFDCSSLVAYLFAQAGVALPRMVVDQYVFGTSVTAEACAPGDLVFSNTGEGRVHYESVDFMPGTKVSEGVDHVGVFLGGGKVLHASRHNTDGTIIESLTESVSFKKIVGYRRMVLSDDERYVVTVPPERLDLHSGSGFMVSGNAADLIEEIGRVYGYENVAPLDFARSSTDAQSDPEQSRTGRGKPQANKTFYWTNKIRDILVAEGFSEVMTYAFQPKGEVELANPLAEDKKFLRVSLQTGLQPAFEMNKKNAPLIGSPVRVFEMGTVFGKDGERTELSLISEDKADAKKALARISEMLGISLPYKNGACDLTEYMEKLPDSPSDDDLKQNVYDISYTPFSPYPFVLRDIAVWTPESVSSSEIEKLVRENAGEWLVRLDLFDTFGKDGKTSYAFHLVFQSHERTLSDDEINVVMERITGALNGRQGWNVR